MKEINKENFYLLLEIRKLKKKLGLAEHTNNIDNLKAERDRLRKLVRYCEEI